MDDFPDEFTLLIKGGGARQTPGPAAPILAAAIATIAGIIGMILMGGR